MSLSMHTMSVGLFLPMLQNLDRILEKAEAHVTAKKIQPGVLENLRLIPDMLPFSRQVQFSCDFAKNGAAHLAGIEPPKFADDEKSLADLRARIAKTVDFLAGIPAAKFEGAETRHVVIPLRTRTLEMDGLPLLQKWTLPNFYFHVTTTYALLRHIGVEIGKQDYLGSL